MQRGIPCGGSRPTARRRLKTSGPPWPLPSPAPTVPSPAPGALGGGAGAWPRSLGPRQRALGVVSYAERGPPPRRHADRDAAIRGQGGPSAVQNPDGGAGLGALQGKVWQVSRPRANPPPVLAPAHRKRCPHGAAGRPRPTFPADRPRGRLPSACEQVLSPIASRSAGAVSSCPSRTPRNRSPSALPFPRHAPSARQGQTTSHRREAAWKKVSDPQEKC